ncbi:hypothetical protein PR048_006857, partial [Dryococelus australis]
MCADNTNSNLGGVASKGVGCTAHVHNTVQAAAVILPIGVGGTVSQIDSFLHIYTVHFAKLKEFCKFVAKDYQKVLGYSKTRWLTPLAAVERLLNLFLPLKSYFQSEKIHPNSIKKFLENLYLSDTWLYFVHNQAAVTVFERNQHWRDFANERVLSLMNNFWTREKTQLSVETLKAMWVTKIKFQYSCVEFFKMFRENRNLLKQIRSSRST